MTANVLVWLRNDLRLADNPALHAAVKLGGKITALYVHETNQQLRSPGGAVLWWLEQNWRLKRLGNWGSSQRDKATGNPSRSQAPEYSFRP